MDVRCPGRTRLQRALIRNNPALPLRDQVGNVLVDFRVTEESDLPTLDSRVPLAASFIVVLFNSSILMIFDRWRRQWELPGGTREEGETARQAAMRELAEETGIEAVELDFAAIAELDLRSPTRREYAAVYRTELRAAPRLVVNNEVADFCWWDPHWPLGDDMNLLDAEIGRRVVEQ
jgi:8-oxo-dGTP pyrophosphatase MutT (NUDIX family)